MSHPRMKPPVTLFDNDSQGQKPSEPPDPKADRDVESPDPDQVLARKPHDWQ